MKIASLSEIKKELQTLNPEDIREMCLRLGRFKKENKELLNYLLFEAQHEQGYVESTKEEIAGLFQAVPDGNVYFIKKSLRRILRLVNRQIKYSGIAQTELEIRIYFCSKMKAAEIHLREGTVLFNLYQQQLNKITTVFNKLPEDLQADYQREVESVSK
jgi:hypothetical protein